ncbi:MAG TPA: filamentous hemagglutinin N-terminal domain-containing protein [Sphingomonas sp.]
MLLASAIAVVGVLPVRAQEMPNGGVVTAGSATITAAGPAATIRQTSDRAIIDWQRFSIGAGGTVAIEQPKATSALLNRVKGSEMSRIAGDITANGQVFLINPNGIVIDQTGKVQARGGFVASTLDIGDDDFMRGKLDFRGGGTGVVANRGYIAGGAVALLGSQVSNDGMIVSPMGRVAIGAAKQATLDLNGDGLLQVAIPSDFSGDAAFITNTGLIDATGGTVMLKVATAREIVRQTINMAGIIRATSASQAGGTVLLDGGDGAVGIAGTVDVSGQLGGRIDVTGGDVALTGATLSAAGIERGGLVRVGGAFQGGATDAALGRIFTAGFGQVAALAAARTTAIDAGSTIDASGGTAGGAIVAWSSDRTRQSGTVTATGAVGGAIELSSKGTLTTGLSRVTTGRGGTLLLDPKNIFVQAGTGAAPPASVAYADAAGTDATFNVADIKTLMDGGTDVFLRASNDIEWNANLSVGSSANPGDLFLSAGRSVAIGGFLTLNQANLTVVANDTAANGVINADREAGAAEINAFNAQITGAIDSGGTGGNIRLTLGSGAGLTNNGADGMRLTSIAARSIAIDAGTRTVQLFGSGDFNAASLGAAEGLTLNGAIRVQASGGATFSGRTVSWLSEASSALTATSPATAIRFTENGVLTHSGILDGGEGSSATDTTRLALGRGAAGVDYSAVYGGSYGAFDALHLVSGTLKSGDTLGAILAAGSTGTTGPTAGQGVGDYAVTTSATSGFALATGKSGYFVDLRTANDTLRIAPKTLTATVAAGAYSYGTPANVASLAGLVGSDSVGLAATVTGLGTQTLSGNAGGYAFAGNLAAGQRNFTLTGLTGAAAANYTLDLSGTIGATLAITPRLLTYAGSTETSTYGTLNTTGFTLSGALSGDDVAIGLAGVSRGGVTTGLTATTGVGTYTTVASALTGSAAGNYAIDAANSSVGAAIINPKTLTYSASSVTSTYGTLASVATPTLSGVVAGDTVGVTRLLGGQALTLADRTAAGSYAITPQLTGTAAGNYTLATTGNTTGTLTINRLQLSYTVADVTQSYGTPAAIATLSGVVSGDEVFAAGSLFNYNGGAVAVGATGIGFNPDVGSHAFNLTGISGAQSGNYRIDLFAGPTTTATLTVTPGTVTYSIASFNRIYGTTAAAPTITFNGGVNASLTGSLLTTGPGGGTVDFAALNNGVGAYTLSVGSLGGAGSQNYVLATTGNTPGIMTITPRTLGYTGSLATSTYGSLASPGAISFSSLVNGDSVSAVTALLSGSTPVALDARTPAGAYTVAVTGITGAAASNYVLGSGTGGALTIDRRTLGYTLGSATSVYGTMAALPVTLDGVVAGDDVAPLVLVAGAAVSARTSVGNYVTRADTLTGAAAGNYRLSATRSFGSLTVTPKPITYAIGASTSVYGDPYNFSGAITFGGVLAGDEGSVATAQFVGGTERIQTFDDYRNVGTYAVEALIAGNPNYALSATGNTLGTYTVTPRPITLDTAPRLLSYGVRPDGIGSGAFLNNVLDPAKVSTSLTLPSFPLSTGGYVNAGSYIATAGALQGEKAGNYVLTGANSLTITVARGTLGVLPGSAQATYGSVGSLANSASPLAARGDVVGFTDFSLARGGTAVAITPQTAAGPYDIVASGISGADAANYVFTPDTIGQFFIAPKPITYTTGDVTSVYGTAAAEPTVTFSGLVSDDRVAASPFGFTAADKINIFGLRISGLTGAAAGNYTIADTGNVFGNRIITPRPLTYSVNPATLIYGSTIDPNSLVTLDGVIDGDSIFATVYTRRTAAAAGSPFVIGAIDALASGSPSAFGALNGGTARLSAGSYQVTFGADAGAATGLLTGSNASLYTLPVVAQAPVALTVLPRPLTYQVTSQAVSTYGDVVPLGVSFSGTLGGGTPAYTIIQEKDGVPTAIGAVANLPANLDASNNYRFDLRLQGADAFNYDATGSATQLAVLKKEVSAQYGAISGVYGDPLANLITLPGMIAGDDLTASVFYGDGTRDVLAASGTGFGFGQLLRNVGTVQFSLQNVTGTDAGNYIIFNSGGTQTLTVTPRPVTYVSAGFSALYGGLSLPTCNAGCEFDTRYIGYEVGTATVSGILDIDKAAVGYDVKLTDGRTVFNYNENTNAGTYAKTIALFGDAAKVRNYAVSQAGSSAGAVFILPAPLKVSISSGGRLYLDAAKGNFQTIGTPGVASYLRSNGPVVNGVAMNALVAGDVVTPVLALQTQSGLTVDAAQTLPVGNYRIVPIALTGADAGNYRLFADPGELAVEDISIFNFGNLIDGSNSVYVAPAAISKPPIAAPVTPRPTGTLTTTKIDGDTSADFKIDGTSLEASAGASGTVSTTSSSGDKSVTVGATGEVDAEVKLAPGKVEAEATAGGSARVSLQIGPGFVDYSAYAQAKGTLEINLFSAEPSIELSAMVRAGLAASAGVRGALGGGLSGELSSASDAFATAFAENKIAIKNGKLSVETQNFVGVGLSTGITLGASGGGVSGSASATVYTPGSLYIGAKSDSGYENQTFSISFSLGLAIGIGGLEIGANLSFSTENIEKAGSLVAESWETVGSKKFYTDLGDDLSCNGACQRERSKANADAYIAAKEKWEAEAPAREQAARQAAAKVMSDDFAKLPKNASGVPTAEQVAFVMSNQQRKDQYYMIADRYGSLPEQVNTLVRSQQALAKKVSADPAGLTLADMKAAQALRAEEAKLLGTFGQMNAQIVIDNGQLKMVSK